MPAIKPGEIFAGALVVPGLTVVVPGLTVVVPGLTVVVRGSPGVMIGGVAMGGGFTRRGVLQFMPFTFTAHTAIECVCSSW